MRRLLVFLLLTGLAVAGLVWLADRPGSVVIRWQGWRVDTTVPVLLAVLAAAMLALSMLMRVVRLVFGAPGRVVEARRARRTRKGYLVLSDGLAAVAAGDARRAHKLARTADRLLGDAPVTALLSAQAARLSGDEAEMRRRSEALTQRPETAFVGYRGLMELAQGEGDTDSALKAASEAFALNPAADGLAVRLFELQVGAGKLAEAEHALTVAKRHGALSGPELDRRRAVLLLARAETALAESDDSRALTLALEARDRDPSLVPASALAVRLFARRGKERKALALGLSAFQAAPHPLLVAAWLELAPTDPLARVKHVQRLSEANPAAAEGHVALAEAALAARLWGQARSHLEKAVGILPAAGTLTLLARLEREERKDEAAAQAWLARMPQAAPAPAWVCGGCGRHAAEFVVRCPSCGAVGRQEWRT